MTDLLALADRVEKLTGPSDALDREIANILGIKWSTDDDGNFGGYNITPRHIRFTASLDAAMTLVPEGWSTLSAWNGADGVCDVHSRPLGDFNGVWPAHAKAKSPALALTAACLRAIASTDKGEA